MAERRTTWPGECNPDPIAKLCYGGAVKQWKGLTQAEAAARLKADGPNALPESERRTLLRLLLEVVRQPMFLLLLVSAIIYLVFGDLYEALTLGGFVVVMIVITVVQEGRTERSLEALRDLSSPRASVLRDGKLVVIPGREVVLGDIVRMSEGDRVPADALLREGTAMTADESLLTGESVPVSKVADPLAVALPPPGGDGHPSLYAGTLVTAGSGLAEIVATGPKSQIGKIGASLHKVEIGRTPLEREIDALVRKMALAAVVLSAGLMVLRGLLEGDWLRAALAGITLAMALLPEEFPVVLTVFLAMGAWRISKKRVLTRRMAAVETLGSVDVLCTDKTGTLTENRMVIRRLCSATEELELRESGKKELPEPLHELVEVGILACARLPFDPMERAFHTLGEEALSGTEHLHEDWPEVRQYPLQPGLLAVTHVWRSGRKGILIATKGAPEAVIDLCHLPEPEAAAWRARVERMAKDGLRVLGVARCTAVGEAELTANPHDFPFEMMGLVGLEDPLRPDVAAAVAECQRAGIRVILITGDHPETGRAIARQAGILQGGVVLGSELEAMPEDQLGRVLAEASVVARAVPQHKLHIVRALRAGGAVVAMTGDGVNDAPALKAADIGIAMGARGTDVAREAASLVLVNDDFGSIVDAVRMGRRIYENLRKAVGYIIAVHVPIAGLALLPVMLGWGAMLAPIHVVFLELVIDPACSIVFEAEPEESGLMQQPPRRKEARLLKGQRVLWSVLQGALVLAVTLGIAGYLRAHGAIEGTLRACSFCALVGGNLGILIANRAGSAPFWRALRRRNRAFLALAGGTVALLALILLAPPLRHLFGFGSAQLALAAASAALGLLPVLAADALKLRTPGEPRV